MAHITTIGQGKNKRYKVMYELPKLTGERRRKSKTFPAGTPKSVVDDFKRQVEIDLATGEFTSDKNITVQDYIENVYFTTYTKYKSPTTVSNYRRLYESKKPYCIKAYFGKYKMKDVTRRMVQQYVNLLSDNVSPKTVRSYLFWFNSVYNTAITEGIIKPQNSPTQHINLPPKEEKDIEPYTAKEISKLLMLSKDDIVTNTIIGLASLAGLRRGEIAGLKWSNVDLNADNAMLHITENRIRIEGEEHIKTPKTKAGKRDIPIPKPLVDILNQAEVNYKTNRLKCGKKFKDSGYVVAKENGEAYSPDGISIHYERFMYEADEKHGVPYKSLHKLRHSYATLLIDCGANPKVVQKNLGHEDIKMTLGTYAHAYTDRQRSEVDKLDSIIIVDKIVS